MDPLQVIPWVLAGLGILSFLGTATVIIKGAGKESVIQTQKDSIEALVEWDRIKSTQLVELRAETEALRQKVNVLEGIANSGDKIDAMRDAVLASIDVVHNGLTEHNTVALERVDTIRVALSTLPRDIAGEIASEIVKAMRGDSRDG